MSDYMELFRQVHKRTEMFISEKSYTCLCAFLLGYDIALGGSVFVGFHEWLVTRFSGFNNLHWEAIILEAAFPEQSNPQDYHKTSMETQESVIDTFFVLFEEYEEIRKKEGLRKIFIAYDEWLKKQDWYNPKLD